jgi:putative hydrolase of the HAD superfamily
LEKDGYQLGLISNAKSDWAVRAILRKFEIDKSFRIVLSSAALRIRKPRPAIFLKALNALDLPPKDSVFIGDSFDADIIGARNVGMHTVYIPRKPLERHILLEPEATVHNLTEAVRTINKWAKAVE